jgi:hypothetical protein
MSATLHARPVSSSSNWNAAGNPIVYKFRREDHAIDQVNNSGGFAQVQMNGVDRTSYYQAGDSIAMMAATLGNTTLYGTISLSSFSGGNTLITTTIPFASVGVGPDDFINNLSKRTDYKLEIEIFKSADDSSLTNGVKLTFTHGRDGVMYVDVSSIIKSYISAEWSLPVSINEIDAEASIKFYIKYQQYYDGALVGSPTSDSANPIHGVFAALQVAQSAFGGNMRDYFPTTSKLWLTKFALSTALQKLVMWRDWPFSVSFMHPDGIGLMVRIYFLYDASGTVLLTGIEDLATANDDSINRLGFFMSLAGGARLVIQIGTPPAQPAGYTDSISLPDSSFASGIAGGSWVNEGVTGNLWSGGGGDVSVTLSTTESRRLTQDLPQNLDSRFIRVQFTATFSASNTIAITAYISSVAAGSAIIAGTGSPQDYTVYAYLPSPPDPVASTLGITSDLITGPVGTLTLHDVTLTEGFLSKKLIDLDIEIRDVCGYDADLLPVAGQNPIHLFWKNSLGGDAFWNFEKYHEYSYTYQNGRKAKRIILFENQLHPVQWEALQELNTTGEIFSTNIIELTSSVNKTSQRIGQQVYMISQDGATKTGVIVIPSSDRAFARDVTNMIAIEIELPEVFQI